MLPTGPAFVFDLETTSADPATARPVEVAAISLDEVRMSSISIGEIETFEITNDGIEFYHERCSPGLAALKHPCFASSVAIHGITAEDVADAPPAEHVLGALAQALGPRAVVGYNVEDYDLKIAPGLRLGPVVDVFRLLVKLREECPQPPAEPLPHPLGLEGYRLSLGAVYALLQGEPLTDAHAALADCMATWAVLRSVLFLWGSYLRPRLDLADDEPYTWEGLAAYLDAPPVGWSDWSPKFKRKDPSSPWVCQFGKHKGWPLDALPHGYKRWMLDKGDFAKPVKALVRSYL